MGTYCRTHGRLRSECGCDHARELLAKLTAHTPTPAEVLDMEQGTDWPGASDLAIETLCDNGNASEERANAPRRLTHSLDYAKEGLAMKATPKTCIPFTGRDSQFQAKAADTHPDLLNDATYDDPMDRTHNEGARRD